MADNERLDIFDDDFGLESLDLGSDSDLDLDALLGDLNLQLSPEENDNLSLDAPIPEKKGSSSREKTGKEKRPSREEKKELRQLERSEKKASRQLQPDDDVKPNAFLDAVANHRGIINTFLILIALVLTAGIVGVIMLQGNTDPYNGRIMNNVSVAGVNVGGMKKAEAVQAVQAIVGNSYSQNDMVVTLGKTQVVLSPSFTHAELHADEAVKAAYDYGRTGTPTERQQAFQDAQANGMDIPLLPYLGIDEAYVRSVLEEEVSKIGGEFVPSGYTLDGKKPSLDAEGFDEATPTQTLVLTVGHPSANANMDAVVDSVMAAYSRNEFSVQVPTESIASFPEELNLDAIYAELNIAPVEATENAATKEVTPGSCGYTFSLEDAKAQLAQAKYGDVISIPMTYVKPEKLDIYGEFSVTLGTYSSPLGSNNTYNKNMELICKSIDGTVLEPGSVFSFNSASIARTEANGFAAAPIHDKYCATENLNAGADQVASTLYVSAVNADLTIMERHNCDHACDYTLRGTELTVGQTWEDLKIRNTLSEPVKIRAKITDSQVVIRILGKSESKYYVNLEADILSKSQFGTANVVFPSSSGYQNQQVVFDGLAGATVQLYRVKYDSNTKTEISRTREVFVEVRPASKIVATVK